jgi:hypothetical protein
MQGRHPRDDADIDIDGDGEESKDDSTNDVVTRKTTTTATTTTALLTPPSGEEGGGVSSRTAPIFRTVTTLQLEERLIAGQLRRTRHATLPPFRIAWYGNPLIHVKSDIARYEGSLTIGDDGICHLILTDHLVDKFAGFQEKLAFTDDAADRQTHVRGIPHHAKFVITRGYEQLPEMSGVDVGMEYTIFVRTQGERKLIVDAIYRRVGWSTSGILVLSLTASAAGGERTQLTWFSVSRGHESTAIDAALGSSSASALRWRQMWCRPTSRIRTQRCESRGTKDVAVIIQGPLKAIGHFLKSAERDENPEVLTFADADGAERFENILRLHTEHGLSTVLKEIHLLSSS